MTKILTEITPLSEYDCFYLVDRYKAAFDYPIHKHDEMEINFVTNCKGCQRIVGDSVETLDNYDLAIVGPKVEHGWMQNNVDTVGDLREITIQWAYPGEIGAFLNKNQLSSLRQLFVDAQSGVAFGQEFIKSVLPVIDKLIEPQPGFMRFLRLLELIFLMSTTTDRHVLSTSSFVNIAENSNSRRIKKVKTYITKNYAEQLRLDDLASMVGMTPTAFSRFFKTRDRKSVV